MKGISRRGLLKLAAVLSAAVPFSTLGRKACAKTPKVDFSEEYDIIVVGSGISGYNSGGKGCGVWQQSAYAGENVLYSAVLRLSAG